MTNKRLMIIGSGLIGLLMIQYAIASLAMVNGEHKYIGIKKCKTCHKSKKRGEQVQQWEGSEHAKAFEHLATPEAKEVAKKAGVEGDPQKSAECLSCHVTGHDAPAAQKEASYTLEEGVSCEACHGAGSSYWKMTTMKKLAAGEQDAKEVGLITPDEALCRQCHNEKSPTFAGFDFKKRYAEIVHQVPKGE